MATRVISIHAPARGASQFCSHRDVRHIFQFTPLREGLPQLMGWEMDDGISIHAPARGASALPRALTWPLELFQFTPLREGLLNFALIEMSAIYFNSRPCERGFHNSWVGKWMTEFQFTPLREGLQQKTPIFLSVFCCFLFINYIFAKSILSIPKFNQYRPYICAIFIAPIS